MASNNNNGVDETTMGLAILMVAAAFFFMAIFAIATFLAFVFTCFALAAWHRPLKIGKETMLPEEARRFVYSGAAGAVALPVFVVFTAILFGVQIREVWWGYIFTAGYDLGALGMAFAEAAEVERAKQAAALAPPPSAPPPQPEPKAPPREREPFEYASWHDDDAGR